jgi:Rrf2 family nitric oxide-sensitive transcriptional repressor
MISQTAEYALRAVVALADSDGRPQTTRNIAATTKVPEDYLSKVLQSLGRAGIITSQRGQGGGSVLAKSPGEITVYEVVQCVDPIARIYSCPLGIRSHGANLCPLHRRLDDAIGSVEAAFRATTIHELLNEPTQSRPLCAAQG